MPPWQVDDLVKDYAHHGRGETEAVSPHVREVTGDDPRDVGKFAEDYASAFVGTEKDLVPGFCSAARTMDFAESPR